MKILSNFDTGLDEQLIVESQAKYGEGKVLFVRRDKVYLYMKVYLPLLGWFVLSVICLSFRYVFLGNAGSIGDIYWRFIWVIVIFSGLRLGSHLVKKLIDFYMDYAIITPDQVIQYDQDGILNRFTRSLDISKIKSISIRKEGLMCSIFNYGSIIFFSEGDADNGDITLNYISDPIKLRDTISEMINLHVQSRSAD